MSLVGGLRARVRALLHRTTADRELAEEIRFHLELETEKNVRLGMRPDEARRVALAHFGGVERVREDHRDVRRLQWIEDAVADLRFALRTIRRTPALSTAAVITLALGIGANVAIFSAVNAVVLQPLPFPAPNRLMAIGEDNPERQWVMNWSAPANMLDWRAGVSDFEDVAGYFDGLGNGVLTGRGDPVVLRGTRVTGSFFSTLAVRPELGRGFTFEETFASGTHVAVLSDRAWRQVFGGDPSVVGKTITVNATPLQVVGVMPPGFSFPNEGIDIWRPMEYSAGFRNSVSFRRAHSLRVIARLKPGVTREHANAQLQAVVARLAHDYPETNALMGATMMPLHDYLVGNTRLPLLVLLTSVAFLLLIACANVGNLLLVQAAGRRREAALRLALGAGRGRLVRQAFAESLTLSVIGGAAGLALGWIGTHALVRMQPEGMLRVHDFGIDRTVLAYVVLITIASAMVFGVAPALWARHRDPAESLKDGGRGAVQGAQTRRWGDTLVVGEVALALLMTVGAGLLVRSFMQLRHVDPGFDPHGVWIGGVGLSNAYDTDDKVDAFMRQLQARTAALPGVSSAALVMNPPLTGNSYTSDFSVYGRAPGDFGTEVYHQIASPGYFATMRIPLLAGRDFAGNDTPKTDRVIIINEALARTYFKGQNPIGQRIAFDREPTAKSTWYTVVGIVADDHADALSLAPRSEIFAPSTQVIPTYMRLAVRTTRDPAWVTAAVRGLLKSMDPALALTDVTTMDALREDSLARTRFMTTLMLMFGLIGLTLSVVGVYGVLAQNARNRMREMGIRIALGAEPADVRWLVVRRGLQLTFIGLALGGVTALFATRAMTMLLFDVAPNDPATLIVVALVLAMTSTIAALLPARRASLADPVVVLRAD